MDTLRKYHRDLTLTGGFIICIIVIVCYETTFSMATAVSIISFVSYASLIYASTWQSEVFYNTGRLFFVVTVYSFLLLLLYWWLSIEMDGDTYLFSKIDAIIYTNYANKLADYSFYEKILYLSRSASYDDWGAVIVMSSIFGVYKSKLFLNICYILIGGGTAVMMFRTACRFMSKRCAYIAALSLTTASYSIFFYGSFLKETIFVAFIVLLINSIYKYIYEQCTTSIVYTIIYSVICCFFRPAVVAMLWLGFFFYFAFRKGGSIMKLVMSIVIIMGFVYALSALQDIILHYTMGGDIRGLLMTKDEGLLGRETGYLFNYVSALLGPFPTLKETEKTLACLYGPGLLYKLYLFLPFLLATWRILSKRKAELYPLLAFIVIESISVAVVQKGYEFRLLLPHVSSYILLALWFFNDMDNEEERVFKSLSPIAMTLIAVFVLAWNILR